MVTSHPLPPGRELDALIAERVMGWEYAQSSPDPKNFFCREFGNNAGWWHDPRYTGWACAQCSPPPQYSTDIAAAWEVVEKMRGPVEGVNCGGDFDLGDASRHRGVYCRFKGGHGYAEAQTFPHAICLAALAAVGPLPVSEKGEPKP